MARKLLQGHFKAKRISGIANNGNNPGFSTDPFMLAIWKDIVHLDA